MTVPMTGRFDAMPDDETIDATVIALEEHGFSVDVVSDAAAARHAVLNRIPHGYTVMTNTSVTLDEAGITEAINEGGSYESARNAMFALDFATQAQEMKAIAGQPDYALGSVHAITRDGTLVIASASGSQFGAFAWGATNVILTSVGAKTGKLRKTPLMRVEHDGEYAVVASLGGAPRNPVWYYNLLAHPQVELQDGPVKKDYEAREAQGADRDAWWERAVAAWPDYAEYQKKTTRLIPV